MGLRESRSRPTQGLVTFVAGTLGLDGKMNDRSHLIAARKAIAAAGTA